MYAGSVYGSYAHFQSVCQLLAELHKQEEAREGGYLGPNVHTLYGFAKDFGVAGWRVVRMRDPTNVLIVSDMIITHVETAMHRDYILVCVNTFHQHTL